MNYLAHIYLSQSKIDLMVGNYIADHIKGKELERFSEGVQEGIRMHRAIDSFTDTHEIPHRTKERLYPKYGKYSAVLVDMFYDHVLAKEWSTYSPIELTKFTQSAYAALSTQLDIFPEKAAITFNYMSKGDWLSGYASIHGIGKALKGVSMRAAFDNNMDEAVVELEESYDLYKQDFEEFFPLMIKHLRPYLDHVD